MQHIVYVWTHPCACCSAWQSARIRLVDADGSGRRVETIDQASIFPLQHSLCPLQHIVGVVLNAWPVLACTPSGRGLARICMLWSSQMSLCTCICFRTPLSPTPIWQVRCCAVFQQCHAESLFAIVTTNNTRRQLCCARCELMCSTRNECDAC